MTTPSTQDIVAHWRNQPAPLLAILHDLHERDGCLTEEALRDASKALRIPIAELYGTMTFYHHFAREGSNRMSPRVCTGPICRLAGAQALLNALGPDATEMPCSGRCDDPIPVLKGNETFVGDASGSLTRRPPPIPPDHPGKTAECVFAAIREPDRGTIDGYRRTGGYDALTRALSEMRPAQILDIVSKSGLAGRGGAGFPTGVKWKAVADAPRFPKSVVCNADEGEPGCFKDRAIMDYDPHALIEGMALAGLATGATRGFIYLRYEYPETLTVLQKAIAQAQGAGFLGDHIHGTEFTFRIHLRRGAGAYICGEEGSLLNSLEGKHPFPRNRPPFPVTHGFENLPTAVNNVETLVSVPPIIRHGADWYHALGLGENAGTKVISLSGDIREPGNYEVPLGLPLKTLLYEWAGGPPEGRSVRAVTMAGLSGGFLAGDALEVTLDEPSIRQHGSFLGAGGIMVFDDSRDMVEVARMAMEFFAEESCGKCFPCRIGTQRLTERLAGSAGPTAVGAWIDEVHDIGQVMQSISACGLGIAAPLITESLLKYFPERVAEHVGASRNGS